MAQWQIDSKSDVGQVLEAVKQEATSRGMTVSRWQANKGSHAVKITYAVHTGDRADQFHYMADNAVYGVVYLSQLEGKTKKSEAYRELSRLLNQVRNAR